MTFNEILVKIYDYVWGVPLIVLILSAGLLLTARTGFIQVRHLPRALRLLFKNESDDGSGEVKGEVTGFASLCTALSATIGTGNIVGVATAVGIGAGGPGALFWMIAAAFFGMATKYSEGFLAVKYRNIDKDGHVLGGPFYYIENGMGKKWKWLAKVFAFFGACVGLMGIGTFSQVNGISSAVTGFFDPNGENTVTLFGMSYSVITVITAFVLAIAAGLVIIGGIKRISKVSEIVVPFMAALYVLSVVTLLISNITRLPSAVTEIIQSAFGIRPIAGGALGSMMISVRNGVARGIFSNESGLGSAPIAAAAAKTKEPVRQGLISMTGTFIDTIVICTMTGLSIVMMGSWRNESLQGVQITTDAFEKGLDFLPNGAAGFILMICLVFFAFTTILGWNYYGERCLEYLSGKNKKAVTVYRILYIAAVFIGPYMTVSAVWTIADIFNGLMALPNIIALFALNGVIAGDTADYFKRLKNGEIKE
ncbi:MAG: sodium:alanine symporter family protein [Ruminococcus sp.]|nr:sodium:alanine symporter family protein [Ruminococcus sp.]